ncbi:MAG: GNAT family N-acetyltransferase [Burkholderiales bacterium]
MSDEASRFSEVFALRSGAPAVLRAIRSDDRERLQTAFRALDPESVYMRYFSYKHELSEADLDRLCNPDFDERVVLVVTRQTDAGEVIIGSGGYVRHATPDGTRAAEVAFTVEEDVQGQGISSKLLAVLTDIARADKIERFDAEVLARNAAMLHVFEHSGLSLQLQPEEDGVLRLSLSLAAAASR